MTDALDRKRPTDPINYQAWSKSMITYLREKGLEEDFKDWCGGWFCPIPSKNPQTQKEQS